MRKYRITFINDRILEKTGKELEKNEDWLIIRTSRPSDVMVNIRHVVYFESWPLDAETVYNEKL